MSVTRPVALAPVRRWIRARRSASPRPRFDCSATSTSPRCSSPCSSAACAWPMIRAVVLAAGTLRDGAGAVAVPLICAGGAVSGPAPARAARGAAVRPRRGCSPPRCRRRSLLAPRGRDRSPPSRRVAGAVVGFAVVSQVTARPARSRWWCCRAGRGAARAARWLIGATVAQRRRRLGPRGGSDARTCAVACRLAGVVADRPAGPPGAPACGCGRRPIGYAVAGLAVVVAVLRVVAYRRLDRTHPETILAAAQATGTVADATAIGRAVVRDRAGDAAPLGRSPAGARLPLLGRLPVLTAADLLVARA